MKKFILAFALVSSFLVFLSCSNKDSEFYNELTLAAPNLLLIDTQTSYAVQDTLWLHTAFSRYQAEENQPNLLDIYQTTGQAPSFFFTFIIEKKAADGSWNFYPFLTNLLVDQGVAQAYDGYYTGYSVYNETAKTYDFKSGLKLTEPGQYRLYFGYESLSSRTVLLRSNSLARNFFINIQSSISALDASGYYAFTVN